MHGRIDPIEPFRADYHDTAEDLAFDINCIFDPNKYEEAEAPERLPVEDPADDSSILDKIKRVHVFRRLHLKKKKVDFSLEEA